MKTVVIAFLLAALAAVVAPANATLFQWQAALDGLQENPSHNVPGHGLALGTYNDANQVITINAFDAFDLTTNIVGTHIHRGDVGVNGPIVVDLLGANGMWNGTLAHEVYSQSQPIVLPLADQANFLGGHMYVNIHTTEFPAEKFAARLQ